MRAATFNPVGFLLNLAIGWFLLAFVQAALRSLFAGSGTELVQRFKAIAFWKDGTGATIDAVLIVVIWVLANGIWYLTHRAG